MPVFSELLTLQTHDSAVDRLRHRREALPERRELAERQAELATVEAAVDEARSRRDAVLREEKRMEDEVRTLEAKAKAVDQKMYSGTISSSKELQAMQADIDQLKRHASDIEDAELELIEQREALDAEVAGLEASAAAVSAAVNQLIVAITEAEVEIDGELQVETGARDGIATQIPADVLGLYEQIRKANRGIGAAKLVGSNCTACHLSLPATEVDRIRHLPQDELVRCEHCSAILVR
jgi:predicted  nucleic acid-binding Zn-ribbon protein